MASSLISSALSGLSAAQTAMATVSHNVANVNTPGYTRQESVQTTAGGMFSGAGYVGSGVRVSVIRRVYDEFLTNQATKAQGEASYYGSYSASMSQLMNAVGDATTGTFVSINKFYSALSDLATRISEPAARQTALASAEAMAAQFRTASSQLTQLRDGANQQISEDVDAINQLTKSIARLNQQIGSSPGIANGQMPNDLLDQRDSLVRELNKLVGVSTSVQDGTQLNVYLSSGQPLVVGDAVSEISSRSDPTSLNGAQLVLNTSGKSVVLREQDVSGGDLGAALAFRNNELAKAEDDLGEIALNLAKAYNAQNQFGLDADGAQGKAMFSIGQPLAYGAKSNSVDAALTINVADVRDMTASDYTMSFDGNVYTVKRASDGQSTTIDPADLDASGAFTLDGMTIKPSNMAAGDSFTINTRRQASAGLSVLIKDPSDIAAASPMELQTSSTNTGSGAVSGLTSTSGASDFDTPVLVRFGAGGTYELLDATDPANPVSFTPAEIGTYTGPSGTISFNGWSFQMNGNPAAGDQFTVAAKAGDPTGDNRNATAMFSLSTAKLVDGKTTLTQAYSVMVSDIGARANEIDAGKSAYEAVLAQAITDESSSAGVNLDEEAAKLLRYQQAYAASGKVLSAANELFDTLLAAIG